jgi:hypothetical protein
MIIFFIIKKIELKRNFKTGSERRKIFSHGVLKRRNFIRNKLKKQERRINDG